MGTRGGCRYCHCQLREHASACSYRNSPATAFILAVNTANVRPHGMTGE